MNQWSTRRWAPHFLLGGGVLAWVLLVLLELLGGPLFARVDGLFIDGAFRFRKRVGRSPRADSRLAPLRIDSRSTERIGRWPWPRSTHARLLKGVQESLRPRGVAMDILFRSTTTEAEDRALAEGFAELGNVSVAMTVGYSDERKRELDLKGLVLPQAPDLERHLLPSPPGTLPGPPWVARLSAPYAALRRSVAGLGHIWTRPDPDRVYRRFRPFVRMQDRLLPSLSILGACQLLRLPLSHVSLEDGELVLKPGGELREERRFPLDDEGFMLINWVDVYGEAFRPVYAWELDEVASGEAEVSADLRARAEDRMWMLGVATLAVDLGPSPMQSERIPLFETHLHAINTLVTGQSIGELPGWAALLLSLLLWVPALLASFRLSPLPGALLGGLPLLLYPLAGLGLFAWGSWLAPFALPWTFLVGSFLGQLAFYLLVVERARLRARDSFARYFNDAVVEKILADPEGPRLGGRKAEITVLFSDIKGFTSTSERIDADLLGDFLGSYFDAMTEIVFRYEGTVDKFMGDGLMAFWGDPVEQEDQADRALAAAQAMQIAARRLDAQWKARLGAPVQVRIGLNTGRVSVGNMGGHRRMEYTVLGRSVNLAQRLESAASPGDILVGEATWERLAEPPEGAERREVQAKGIDEPVVAYEVPGEPPASADS